MKLPLNKFTTPSLVLCALLTSAGCAFDIVRVKQLPVRFVPSSPSPGSFVLANDVKAKLGTSFPTQLKAGTHWRQVGSTEFGEVFATTDQIVTVEASNIHEAQLVVTNQQITGFYLPVEKTFAPVRKPIQIQLTPTTSEPHHQQ